MVRDVRDYASPQAAFDAAKDGDVVAFPGTQTYTAPAGGWTISKSLQIVGDGMGSEAPGSGTQIFAPDIDTDIFVIVPPAVNVTIRELQLVGADATPGGTSVAIRWLGSQTDGASELVFRGLCIHHLPSHGIFLPALDGGARRINGLSVGECLVEDCGGAGLRLEHVWSALVTNSTLRRMMQHGLYAKACAVSVHACTVDGNVLLAAWNGTSNPTEGNLKFENGLITRLDGLRILNVQAGNVRRACTLIDCGPSVIGACDVSTAGAPSGTYGFQFFGAGNGSAAMLNNRFSGIQYMIVADPAMPAMTLFPQYDATGDGSIVVPGTPNLGLTGLRSVYRGAAGNLASGLILPSGSSDPSYAPLDGMLAFNTSQQRVRVRKSGVWQNLKLAGPAKVSNLAMATGHHSIVITWTAPACDSPLGRASGYDLRYSTAPITDANFYAATHVSGVAAPEAPATPECKDIQGLSANTTYYVALKAVDDIGSWSAISNLPSGKTKTTGGEVECP